MVALLHQACPNYFPAHVLEHLRAGADKGRSQEVECALYKAGWGAEGLGEATDGWKIVPGRIMLKYGISPARAAGGSLVSPSRAQPRASRTSAGAAYSLCHNGYGVPRPFCAAVTVLTAPAPDTFPGLQDYTPPAPAPDMPQLPPDCSDVSDAPEGAASGASGPQAHDEPPAAISGLGKGDVEVVTLGTAASVPGERAPDAGRCRALGGLEVLISGRSHLRQNSRINAERNYILGHAQAYGCKGVHAGRGIHGIRFEVSVRVWCCADGICASRQVPQRQRNLHTHAGPRRAAARLRRRNAWATRSLSLLLPTSAHARRRRRRWARGWRHGHAGGDAVRRGLELSGEGLVGTQVRVGQPHARRPSPW